MKVFFVINESWRIHLRRIALVTVLCCQGICGFSQGWVLEVEVDLNHVDCAIERLQYASASFNGFSSSSSGPFTGSRTILTIIGSGSTTGTLSVTANGSCDEVYYPEFPVSTINSSYSATWNFSATCVTNTSYSSASGNPNELYGSLYFYPTLSIDSYSSNCGALSFAVNPCQINSLTWEFNTSPPGPNWYPIVGKSGQSISVTPIELYNSNLANGRRTIRVTGVAGTTSPVVVVDINVAAPELTVVVTQPSCPDGKGRIDVTINNQNAVYANDFLLQVYHQSDNIPGPIPVQQMDLVDAFAYSFMNVDAGSYKVLARNNSDVGNLGSCSSLVQNISITPPPVFGILPNPTSTPVSCHTGDVGTKNDGSITLNLQNGSPPYSYEYSSNGGTNFSAIAPDNTSTLTPSFNGLVKGNYIFKASYLSGSVYCVSAVSSTVAVAEPAELSPSVPFKTNVLCQGKKTGAIDFENVNGNGSYTYSWTGPSSFTSSDQDISSLFAGTYSVTVTDSKGCRPDALPYEVFIVEPTVALTVTPTKVSVGGGFDMTCAQNDGEISLSLANQAMPLQSVNWKKDGVPFSPVDPLDAKNLSAATYSITVVDNKGCDASASKSLIQHPGITVATQVTSGYNGYSTTCSDSRDGEGRVQSVVNGFGSYSYVWSNATTNQTITDLVSGNYLVTVMDGNGCTDSETIIITSPPPIQPHLQITSNYNGAQIRCPGGNDGRMEAFATNGFGPTSGGNYYYSWSHDISVTTKFSKDLAQGLYKVKVTDGYGCSAEESLSIIDPVIMSLALSKKNYNGADVSCHNSADGEIQLAVTNGATPYSYSWSDGKSTKDNIGLTSGNYTVTVTDANACERSKSLALINPDELTVNVQHANNFNGYDISCYNEDDGAALAVASGGTGAYNYLWINGVNTASNSALVAGNYSVTVSDINNCQSSDNIDLIQPPDLTLSAALDNPVSCFGQSDAQVTLTTEGGVSQYKYSLDPNNPSGWQTQPVFSLLPFGTKDFYVKDGNGCSLSVQKDIPQPDALDLTFNNMVDAACNNPVGSASVIIKGGNSGFVYSWFDEVTNQQLNSAAVLQNVIAGIYRVEIKDSKNCSITDQVAISSIGGATFAIDNITGVSCFGFKDGMSSVSVTSGIAPYTYAWSDGQSSQSASALAAGKYFITVLDGLGCKTIQQMDIPTPQPLTSQYLKTMPLCTGDCNGQLEVTAAGGTAPYQYNWTTLNKSSALVSSICAGTYDFKLSDAHGCVLNDKVELKGPDPVTVSAVINKPICLGRCDASISLTGGGGTGVYSYAWESGATTSSIKSLCPGDYKVQMKDSHGCLVSDQYTVLNASPLPLDLGTKATLCVGQIKVLNPGPQWVISNWTSNNGFAKNTSSVSIKDPGVYYYKGIDAQGCIAMDTFKLETSLDLLKAEFLMPAEIVVGDTLVAIDISWPLPERVEWNYPSSFKVLPSPTSDISLVQPLEPGTFSITMKSFLAECRDFREKTLTVLSAGKSSSGGRLGNEELIKEFSMYPNPNDGQFSVLISLSEEKQVRLRLVQFPVGIVIADYFSKSSNDHKVDFELPNIPSGMYVILLDVDGEQRIIRFLKK